MNQRLGLWLCMVLFSLTSLDSAAALQEQADPVSEVSQTDAIAMGVAQLLEIQDDDGAWPYEGVYRVNQKIPVGYRVGGTAICCQALMYATPADRQITSQAVADGVNLILRELDHPLMAPSQADRYDVRVWGHIYALDLFCRIQQSDQFPDLKNQTAPWIHKLTQVLLEEELKSGGWNYANRRAHAGFVTAPAVQALLWARQCGETIPDSVWKRSAEAILRSRNDDAAFAYSGNENSDRPTKLPGSIARSANCEATLSLLGLERNNAIATALNAFHVHWDELEKRRKKSGTHKPPYGVAPYYFYYGHRYAAFAIQQLPKELRPAEFERLFQVILRTRDPDGTWNDRVFARSRAYGTAMTVLALLENEVPQPAGLRSALGHGVGNGSFDPKSGKPVGDLVLIRIEPELITPRIQISLSPDRIATIDDQTIALGELQAWMENRPDGKHPNCILIYADAQAKVGDVERLKEILTTQFGEVSMYVTIGAPN